MPDDTKAVAADSNLLPVTQRAANALKSADTESALVALAEQSKAITTITNAAPTAADPGGGKPTTIADAAKPKRARRAA